MGVGIIFKMVDSRLRGNDGVARQRHSALDAESPTMAGDSRFRGNDGDWREDYYD
ncbi:MAG: hypothetical protein LBE35_11730 [Clostridiales bacterium]|nr:hypothetical protein [Clostridiales bacterium]